MTIQIKRAMTDFDHPLEMLAICHERIEARCETLRRLAAHLPVHGCDAQAQQAASNVMRYFDSAGRHHREDEERDLFPVMIAAAQGENAERIALLVGQLAHEHHEMEKMWLGLRDALESIAHGENAPLDAIEVSRFCGMYRAHMAMEEANLFPLAELLLETGALTELGKAMAKRRGVKT
jgi:hemerythrin-like domain-containing protein